MKTKLLVAFGLLAAFSAVLVLPFLRGAATFPSDAIFRSTEDLLSLRRVLDEPAALSELSSLSKGMLLWQVATSTEPAPAGTACISPSNPGGPPERIRHRFEFASWKAVSSRVFKVDCITCKQDQGSYLVSVEPGGFGSDFSRRPARILTGASALTVFKLALNDPGVASDLVRVLQNKEVKYCRLTEEGDAASEQGPMVFRFVAADGVPGEAGTSAVVDYLAAYDPVNQSAVFERNSGG